MAEKQLTLDEIIAELDKTPDTIKDRVDKHTKARETYKIGNNRPKNYHATIKELANWIKHHSKTVDNGVEKPDHHAVSEASDLLLQYGAELYNKRTGQKPPSEKEAIKEAMKFIKKGKLAQILDSYRDEKIDEEELKYEKSVFAKYLDPLDRAQHLKIATDYVAKYKHILGDEATKKLELMKPAELVDQASNLLRSHRASVKIYQEQIARKKPEE